MGQELISELASPSIKFLLALPQGNKIKGTAD